MTKNQALDKLDKAVSKVAEAGLKRIETNLPKLKASAKKLAEQIKANESPDLIDTQIRHLKLQMRGVAEGTTLLDEAVRRLKEFEKDEELFELLADEMTEAMGYATRPLEGARKELATAKKLLDQAVKAGEQHGGDSKQAREEWAEAVAEVDRLPPGAQGDQGPGGVGEGGRRRRAKRDKKAWPAAEGQAGFGLSRCGGQAAGRIGVRCLLQGVQTESLDKDLREEIKRDRDSVDGPGSSRSWPPRRRPRSRPGSPP